MWQKQGQIYLQPLLLIEYKWKKHPTERFAPQMWCHFFEGQGKTVEKASKRWKFSVRQKRSEKWLTWGDSQFFFFFCLLPLPPENRIQTNQKNTWRSYWELALKWPSINWFLLVFIVWVNFYVVWQTRQKPLCPRTSHQWSRHKSWGFYIEKSFIDCHFLAQSIHLI